MQGIECCIIHLFLKLFSFKHCVFAFICTSVNYKKFIATKKKKRYILGIHQRACVRGADIKNG